MKKQKNAKILENLFKERFDEVIELTNETNFDDLIYYFKGNSSRKRSDDFRKRDKTF